jgi:uncharacterized membrane protein
MVLDDDERPSAGIKEMPAIGLEHSGLQADEETLLKRLRELDPARNANIAAPLSLSQRLAVRLAAGIGSWRFVLAQTLFFGFWIAFNLIAWAAAWDPYPFILLDLLLALQGAYMAPIIVMGQNRQASIDRYHVLSDYEVNLTAALEVKLLHHKIDAIRSTEIGDVRDLLLRIEKRLDNTSTPGCIRMP